MRINTNIPALISNNNLQKSQVRMATAIERLSSGYKINHAKDDPAGAAISNIMRSQIRALEQAENNASNGISVIETAEGAMEEIGNMLQRMNELAVKAVNGSNTDEDREAIQLEIDALCTEIDRISKDTEFNDQSLLDGNFQRRVYFEGNGEYVDQAGATQTGVVNLNSQMLLLRVTDIVEANNYNLSITSKAEKATGTVAQGSIQEGGSYRLNSYSFDIPQGATDDEITSILQKAGEKTGITITRDANNNFKLESEEYGSDIVINFVDLQRPENDNGMLESAGGAISRSAITNGKDVGVTIPQADNAFSETATIITKGDKISVHDINGFELTIKVGDYGETATTIAPQNLNVNVKDMGKMQVQIGANEGQSVDFNIAEVSCATLGLEDINVLSESTASRAIEKIQSAINTITANRTQLGAYQNQLEYSVSNLSVSQENMTTAYSRIKDLDMAEEMTEYTQTTVLSQAATSVLAQANARPETVLQLLAM